MRDRWWASVLCHGAGPSGDLSLFGLRSGEQKRCAVPRESAFAAQGLSFQTGSSADLLCALVQPTGVAGILSDEYGLRDVL